jgi:hypothetical protein
LMYSTILPRRSGSRFGKQQHPHIAERKEITVLHGIVYGYGLVLICPKSRSWYLKVIS